MNDLIDRLERLWEPTGLEVLREAAVEIERLLAENVTLKEAIQDVWVSWHAWRDDPSDNTIYFVQRAVNEAGELIPPPKEQK